MNIQVTIGVTPELEKALLGLSKLVEKVEHEGQAPVQQAVQAPPAQQQAPVQEPVPTQQAPVQQAPPAQQQTPPPQQAPVQQAVPTSAPTYDQNQLAVAATQLMDAGRQQDLVNLLNSFNVQALTALPQEQYGAFATKLRELGANI